MQIENLNNPVSKNVLRIIKEKGMKQCVVAERAGYSRSALNNMLNGRKVMKICRCKRALQKRIGCIKNGENRQIMRAFRTRQLVRTPRQQLDRLYSNGKGSGKMPKSNFLKTEASRKNYASRARAGIKRHIELSKVPEDRIAAKQNVQVRTLMNRIEDPGSMRLRDLWDLAEIIGAPVGELAGGDLPEEMLAKLLQQKLL